MADSGHSVVSMIGQREGDTRLVQPAANSSSLEKTAGGGGLITHFNLPTRMKTDEIKSPN